MKSFLLLILSLTLAACSGGGGSSGSSETADQIYGEWYYEAPGSSASSASGVIGKIDKDGNFSFLQGYAYSDGTRAVFYVRKNIGRYIRNGNEFKVTYTYETCSPIGEETLNVSMSGDKLIVATADGSFSLMLSRMSETTTLKNIAMIEDTGCNILSKIERKDKRAVANVKAKSFFDRVKKMQKP
jgi:hypothetical protein